MKHICLECGRDFPIGFNTVCDSCGGMVDVTYDLTRVDLPPSENPFIRYAGLLPLTESATDLPDAVVTPLVHATALGESLGLSSLYLKNETVLPTRTTKDRMAAVALAYLHERGVRSFCASSTGNSSTSFAHAIGAHPDMHLHLFTAERFVPRVQHAVHAQVTHYGLRGATFVEAGNYATQFARRHGFESEGGFFNPGRREGLKLAFLEACEQLDRPIDWYVQAVSSAMGVYGVFKAAKEMRQIGRIRQLPRLLCVQQESCAPMARAFAEGSAEIRPDHRVATPTGIAEAILRGDPTRAYKPVRRIVLESGGGFAAVSEAEIRAARRAVETLEGISTCFSAAAAVAGLMKLARAGGIAKSAVVMVNLTGADRPEPPHCAGVQWIEEADWRQSMDGHSTQLRA
jgi:threonine synthase